MEVISEQTDQTRQIFSLFKQMSLLVETRSIWFLSGVWQLLSGLQANTKKKHTAFNPTRVLINANSHHFVQSSLFLYDCLRAVGIKNRPANSTYTFHAAPDVASQQVDMSGSTLGQWQPSLSPHLLRPVHTWRIHHFYHLWKSQLPKPVSQSAAATKKGL